jgi:hypothetical protein
MSQARRCPNEASCHYSACHAHRKVPDVITSHPKVSLYEHVYDPLVTAWFAALGASPELKLLLDCVPERDLVTNLRAFNDLCYALMEDCVSRQADNGGELITTVNELHDHVLWADHQVPDPDAGPDALMLSICEKMKRNLSMGVIEALICLESACRFGRSHLKLDGSALTRVLLRSRQLYTSLSALHDEQEKIRLMFLTGINGYLSYPEHNYAAVAEGHLTIEADKFIVVGSGDDLRLRFVTSPVSAAILDSPALRCPAHRLRSDVEPDKTINDILWRLLIDIYQRIGRFDY